MRLNHQLELVSVEFFPATTCAMCGWRPRARMPEQTGDCSSGSFVCPLQMETGSTHHLLLCLFWQLGGSFPVSQHLDQLTLGQVPTLPHVYYLHSLLLTVRLLRTSTSQPQNDPGPRPPCL